MHIAMLAHGEGWHVRDLQRAATLRGHSTSTLDFRRLQASVALPSEPLQDTQALIVRTMSPGSLEQVIFRMDVLQRAEARGVRVLNPPRALETCIDKYLTTARLHTAGLRVPATIVCQDADDAMTAWETLGRDVVVKPIFGSEGRGMMRIDNADLAWRTFRTLERLQHILYLQQYIAHPGWDLRMFVLAGKVVAAMRRHARGGWRTNIAQGGAGEAVPWTALEEELALRAAAATGVVVAGVDLLPGPDGVYHVLEVNAVPGWRALGRICKLDVALAIIDWLEQTP